MAPIVVGAQVATVGDLTAAITQLTEKIEEQKGWTQQQLDLLLTKHTDYVEKTDEALKALQNETQTSKEEINVLKATTVLDTKFREAISTVELKVDTVSGALEQQIKKTREDSTRDLTFAVQDMTTKVDACELGVKAVRESMHEITSTLLPEMREQLEDERKKRREGDARLEKNDEVLRESSDRRCEEIIALLKKDIEDAVAKLKPNLATKEELEAILRELAALRTSMTTQFTSIDDSMDGLKEALKNHVEKTAASFEKTMKDISILMNDSRTMQGDIQQLTTSTSADFKKIREYMKDAFAQLKKDLSEARAAAAQAAVNNEKNIQVVAAEVTPLKEARSVLFDRLKIKDVAGIVRDWQAGHVPTTTASLSDLEARVARLKNDLQTEHDHGVELSRSMTAVRGHFKMFHSIASGLDATESPGAPPASGGIAPGPAGTTLPPIGGGH
jgi:hypothetical protein